ncbi:MAG: hypothetical protein PWR24_1936 [Desulfonauticus sp.]|nr:hypothetical protein [Desulfonauticus sp.]
MIITDKIEQVPTPGEKFCRFTGDTITFELKLKENFGKGIGFVRTNIGYANVMKREIIRKVEQGEVKFFMDWHDIPMNKIDEDRYLITLPLCEVGHFEAKCYFLEEDKRIPIWPEGPNVSINVKPAITSGANIIYNAFVRLFGPSKKDVKWMDNYDLTTLDKAGFHVIYPSGTFRDLIEELDFIIYELGCRYIQLLPIFPVPTTYRRLGKMGSPYAVLDFYQVDRALAKFDPKKTPLEQFMELANEIHKRDGLLILDMPINHTGWGSRIHDVHPEWIKRKEGGEIEVPVVWGVTWADLTKLDYSKKELWEYMADVFLTWCERGVDGFRGDAGYMLPIDVWEYIISKVRESFPDTVFFLEGLGGPIDTTRALLNGLYDWAYSELFQNYTKEQIIPYVDFSTSVSKQEGIMVHFSETHDNNRLASLSETYSKMRNGLCAMLSYAGAFGFACGVEWFCKEKINVHEITSLNWGNSNNQVQYLRRINAILKVHHLFFKDSDIKFIESEPDEVIVAFRTSQRSSSYLIIIVNLDTSNLRTAKFSLTVNNTTFFDLITRKQINMSSENGRYKIDLSPGEVLCLSPNVEDIKLIDDFCGMKMVNSPYVIEQIAKEKLYKILNYRDGIRHTYVDEEKELNDFLEDPYMYLKKVLIHVIKWSYPEDIKRTVMLPYGAIMIFVNKDPFQILIKDYKKVVFSDRAIKSKMGYYFVIFMPDKRNFKAYQFLDLKITLYGDMIEQKNGKLLLLPRFQDDEIKNKFFRHELMKNEFTYLASNKRGAVSYIPVWWSELDTKYNAILSANINPEYLDDRWVMFTRLRIWVIHQGYSEYLSKELMQRFYFDFENRAKWDFYVPTGIGKHIHVTITVELSNEDNEVKIKFFRYLSKEDDEETDDVKIILRPDLESRSHHENTKAYMGAEKIYPKAISNIDRGFLFHPHDNAKLKMMVSSGRFVLEPEWSYMVYLKMDKERGMDPYNDLFSPGYFEVDLKEGQGFYLVASVNKDEELFEDLSYEMEEKKYTFSQGLKASMERFLVKNKVALSVVAGFPWFLDWGRDSLIYTRALVEDGRFDLALDILKYFGRYEQNGTLPNLIKRSTPLNRDTSDAPLWFCVVCGEVMEKIGMSMLDTKAGDRSLGEIIVSIVKNYIQGTENRIKMDEESCLIYSPPHFTWMDTNYPACTPREGYPIEIQALWYRTLCVMEKIDPENDFCIKGMSWDKMKQRVRDSVERFYFSSSLGYLSDCLHCEGFEPANCAKADDHLRPNQLLSITLGLIDNRKQISSILDKTSYLLIPGGIRSLADTRVSYSLVSIPKEAISDSFYPYKGRYIGDEDTMRKPAYHNGTAWTWMFPLFVEGYFMCYGDKALDYCLSLLSSSKILLNTGCVGHIPEIMDGDYPHVQRGCLAQAWGVSELYRVLIKLKNIKIKKQ